MSLCLGSAAGMGTGTPRGRAAASPNAGSPRKVDARASAVPEPRRRARWPPARRRPKEIAWADERLHRRFGRIRYGLAEMGTMLAAQGNQG
jgi:hypothetical protein